MISWYASRQTVADFQDQTERQIGLRHLQHNAVQIVGLAGRPIRARQPPRCCWLCTAPAQQLIHHVRRTIVPPDSAGR